MKSQAEYQASRSCDYQGLPTHALAHQTFSKKHTKGPGSRGAEHARCTRARLALLVLAIESQRSLLLAHDGRDEESHHYTSIAGGVPKNSQNRAMPALQTRLGRLAST